MIFGLVEHVIKGLLLRQSAPNLFHKMSKFWRSKVSPFLNQFTCLGGAFRYGFRLGAQKNRWLIVDTKNCQHPYRLV